MLELESGSNDPMAMTLVAIDQDPEAETFGMEVPKEMGGIRVMKVRLDIIVDVGPDAGRVLIRSPRTGLEAQRPHCAQPVGPAGPD